MTTDVRIDSIETDSVGLRIVMKKSDDIGHFVLSLEDTLKRKEEITAHAIYRAGHSKFLGPIRGFGAWPENVERC